MNRADAAATYLAALCSLNITIEAARLYVKATCNIEGGETHRDDKGTAEKDRTTSVIMPKVKSAIWSGTRARASDIGMRGEEIRSSGTTRAESGTPAGFAGRPT